MKGFHEECAVFGVWNDPEASRMGYLGLFAQQHRGQESAGMVSLHNEGYHVIRKGLGLVGDVFQEEHLDHLKGRSAIGHVRYSTTGKNFLINAQPLTADLKDGPLALAHNGNIVNAKLLREELIYQGSIFHGTNDTECLLHLMARERSSDVVEKLAKVLPRLEGAYSMVLLTGDRLMAVRDPRGFRPLVLGKRPLPDGGESTVLASETCAFDLIGAKFVREIEPGEIFWVDQEGEHSQIFHQKPLRRCIFEHIYFSRPDSLVFSKSVYEVRKKMGEVLSRESSVEADLVIPVPDSGVPAALGYSLASGIPFDLGIVRNHYVGRTFIQPSQSIRSFGVKIKLNPQSAVLKGRRVIVVDDSLVRGTTSQKIIRLVRQAGAREVHFRIASPPTTGACYYGVDTPERENLIAAHKTVEEIRAFIDADSLAYLSVGGMVKALGGGENPAGAGYCAACFDGEYPTKLP